MRNCILLLSVLGLALTACTGVGEVSAVPTADPSVRATEKAAEIMESLAGADIPTLEPKPTNTPTITPTPIGGSQAPILAIPDRAENGQPEIVVMDLFSEKAFARIPVKEPGETLSLSPNGEYLAFVDKKEDEQGIFLYHLLSKETKLMFSQPDETSIYRMQWSPNQNWLAFDMTVFATQSSELWVIDIANEAPRYLSSIYEFEWLDSGELYYQARTATRTRLDLSSGNSQVIKSSRYDFSTLSAIFDDELSNMGTFYLPRLEADLVEGTNLKDLSNPHHYLVKRETDEAPGIHLADFTTETEMRVWELLLSPAEETWVVCVNEGEGIHSFYSNGLPGGRFFTSWAPQNELPISSENITIKNFQPLGWAPDESSMVGLRHDPSSSGGAITGIEILDIDSGRVLYFYEFSEIGGSLSAIKLAARRPRSFDLVWSEDQIDLSHVTYTPPTVTPTATLEPGVTPSPTTPANKPFLVSLENPILIDEYDVTALNQNDWEFSGTQVKDDEVVEVSGSGSWDAYLDSKFEILPDQGVFARIKYTWDTVGILALTRGEWATTSYRQWGTIFSSGTSRPIVSYGSDHSAQAEILSDITLEPGVWYSVFIGHYNNQLLQIIWDPINPLEYHLSLYDYGDDDEEPYYFHIAGNTGDILISEVSVYGFDTVNFPAE